MKDEGGGPGDDEERTTHILGPTLIILTTPPRPHSQSGARTGAETVVSALLSRNIEFSLNYFLMIFTLFSLNCSEFSEY